jgi:hypothetical protein
VGWVNTDFAIKPVFSREKARIRHVRWLLRALPQNVLKGDSLTFRRAWGDAPEN